MNEKIMEILKESGIVTDGFEIASVEIKGKYKDFNCMSAIYLSNPNFK